MSRRLLTTGLTLAALLGALAWAGRSAAKPPELPLADQDVLAPQTPAPAEASNPFPLAGDSRSESPTMEAPLFFRIRPSTRRMVTSCLLFGVHPLLTLAPSDEYVDFDEDDAPPVPAVFLDLTPRVEEAPTGSLTFGVGVSSDGGLIGSIQLQLTPMEGPACGSSMKSSCAAFPHMHACQLEGPPCSEPYPVEHPVFQYIFELGNELPHDCAAFFPEEGGQSDAAPASQKPELIGVAPKESSPDESALSVCPWMRQQPCGPDRQAFLFADVDISQDVRRNLEMLRDARTLIDTAKEFGRAGRVVEAAQCLGLACEICPGSRMDDAVQETAAYLFAPLDCGSPDYDFGADEQAEPPADATAEDREAAEVSHKTRPRTEIAKEKEREIEQKLAQPATMRFQNVPLRQVIDDLHAWQNINIYVDTAALEAEEVSLDHPVSVALENISLKSALNLILKQAHLTYVIKDEVLQITTERGARGKMQRVTYAVSDLLDGDLRWPGMPVETEKKSPEETLVKLITNTICPREWCGMGGPGTIDIHPLTRSLVVNQTPDVQEQVADLLNALRRMKDAAGADEDEEVLPCVNEVREERESAVERRAGRLLRACHAAMEAGDHRGAAAFAEMAFALDPEQAAADPLVYKMHVIGDGPAPAVRPRRLLEPELDSTPFAPCLPPVDPATPAALDQLYPESAPVDGAEEQEAVAAPSHGSFEFGLGLDGSVQMFGQLRRGGSIWHAVYRDGNLSVWASPDGGADAAPAEPKTADDDSGDD